MQNRAARRNIRVGQDIEHKGDGQPIHQVPAFTQQIFGDGVEAGANAVVQVCFKDHQPGMEHAEPGKDQRRQRPEEPRTGHDHWQGKHPGTNDGSADDHHAAKQRR